MVEEDSMMDPEFDQRWDAVKHLKDEVNVDIEALEPELALELLETIQEDRKLYKYSDGSSIVLPCDLFKKDAKVCGWTGYIESIKSTDGKTMHYPIAYDRLAKILEVINWNDSHGTKQIVLKRELTPEGEERYDAQKKEWTKEFYRRWRDEKVNPSRDGLTPSDL